MRKWHLLGLCVSIGFCAAPGPARASVVEYRSDLTTFLGSAATTEDFSKIDMPTEMLYTIGSTLDSTTTYDGQGPGLVNPGLTFNVAPAPSIINWDGGGNPEGTMGTQHLDFVLGTGGLASINFATPTPGAGLDVLALGSYSMDAVATFAVYDQDGNVLFSSNAATGPDPIFFGYESPQDPIGSITLTFASGTGVIEIDNVLYAAADAPALAPAVPEPATLGLGSASLVMLSIRRKRT